MTPAPYPAFDGTQACAEADPEMFFPDRGQAPVPPEARALCARCPWLRSCLRHALSYDLHGVWGGTSQAERRRIQQEYGIAVAVITAAGFNIRTSIGGPS